MSTVRGGMNRSLLSGLMGMIAAASLPTMSNALEIKTSPEMDYARATPLKMPGMSPRDYFRNKAKSGHPRRKKNLLNCARKAKLKRRRAA